MPRPVTVSQTGTGTTQWFNLDTWAMPMSITINLTVSGSATYNIEVTNSDYLTAGMTVNAFPLLTAATTSQQLTSSAPARAWRINVTAGSGTVTAEAVQAGLGQ